MTKREAQRQNEQEHTLIALGFTSGEAEVLRRISMTLHRWHERECGSDSACLVRGRWNQDAQTFEYDDDGPPHEEYANGSGRHRYARVPDRERGALARLAAILKARNARPMPADMRPGELTSYIQGDPRGAALYIIRPGDVPDGQSVNGYYTRGICVY
jgi:hypothetical protein